uniref:Carbonic anhydrase n=1 Tax=Sphenodon punctatus TaxID=8508 RepID=A0A8D0HPJ2_SPHPU
MGTLQCPRTAVLLIPALLLCAGMRDWALDFQPCDGQMQSPINIDPKTTTFSPELQPIMLSGYDLPPSESLKLKKNGHTIMLSLPENLTMTGGYAQEYRAAQLHLHWGSRGEPGSEHTVNGHRFAGEIHVVYYNSRFDNIKEAMSEPGGLAVLAAFLEAGPEENVPYQHILEHLEEVQEEGKALS